MVAQKSHSAYTTNSGRSRGKMWLMKRASMVALPACKEGKAPKTMGDAVKVEV